MADTYLGVDANGLLNSANNPVLLPKPISIDVDGKITLNVGGAVQGYLTLTVDGYLEIGGPPELTLVQIACGTDHTLFLFSDGSVYSCGRNTFGELARVVETGSVTNVNLGKIEALSNIIGIGAGNGHSIFLRQDGAMFTCGRNQFGQLGRAVPTGTENTINLGQITELGTDVASIICGENHNLIIMKDGTVQSCGSNGNGQLARVVDTGNETTVNLGIIPGLTNIVFVSANTSTSAFISSSGSVYNAGYNTFGTLGRVTPSGTESFSNLGEFTNLTEIEKVSHGTNFTIFQKTDKTIWTCGRNNYGQLGRIGPEGSETSINLEQVTSLTNVSDFKAGNSHAIYTLEDGRTFTCGRNQYGQLGRSGTDGSTTTANLEQVTALTNVNLICAGNLTSFWQLTGGAIYNAGNNGNGPLGRAVANGSQTGTNLGELEFL